MGDSIAHTYEKKTALPALWKKRLLPRNAERNRWTIKQKNRKLRFFYIRHKDFIISGYNISSIKYLATSFSNMTKFTAS